MKLKLLTLFTFCIVFNCLAQKANYTYMTDKKFAGPDDLVGYKFVPNHMETPGEGEEDLNPGAYSFGVTRNNLYVKGEDIKGVYNVNNINTTEYGYKLNLMNARDPRQQGHLKVILIGRNYVDAIVFKKSKDHKEMIFFLPEMSEKMVESDKEFYTDRLELELEDADSIWGTTIYPYFRVFKQGNVHERLYEKDSTWISFVEVIDIVDKTKAPKGKKKKKGDYNIETGEHENEEDAESEEEIEKKLKITKSYYVDVRSMYTNEEGGIEDVKDRYEVKRIKEREDELAEGNSERYQIEIETNKGIMHLYLTGRRTISSFEIGGEQYLTRGN